MRILLSLLALLVFSAPAIAQPLIVVDPGHGGNDPGGTGTGLEEKDIVLSVSQRFRDLLDADTADEAGGSSWSVELTRDTDVFVSLAARSAFANGRDAERFMSVHANAFGDPSANGTETFSFAEGTISAEMRNLVQEEMISAWALTNRGNKTGNYSVLRETAMPAELHELGFVTNAIDADKLASPDELQNAAEAHLRAIQRHMGFAPYIPGTEVIPQSGSLTATVYGPDGVIAEATITLDGTLAGTTNSSGVLQVDGIEVGEYLIAVRVNGYRNTERSLEIRENQVTSIDFDLEQIVQPECDDDGESCEIPTDAEGGCSASSTGRLPLGSVLVFLVLCMRLRRRRLAK
tara:strand:- start:65899 stop:66942 length:1044 start_codon:yes stop_codon:yes gene_type:complete